MINLFLLCEKGEYFPALLTVHKYLEMDFLWTLAVNFTLNGCFVIYSFCQIWCLFADRNFIVEYYPYKKFWHSRNRMSFFFFSFFERRKLSVRFCCSIYFLPLASSCVFFMFSITFIIFQNSILYLYWCQVPVTKWRLSTLMCSELHFFIHQRRAKYFAWLSGAGIYHGDLNFGAQHRWIVGSIFSSYWSSVCVSS